MTVLKLERYKKFNMYKAKKPKLLIIKNKNWCFYIDLRYLFKNS